MEVSKDKVVSIDYKLTNNEGEVIDSSEGREPLDYLHGHGNIVPGLEKALEGKTEGEAFDVKVTPDEGYGERDDRLVQSVPKENFPSDAELKPGMMFQAQMGDQRRVFTVEEVGDSDVRVNGNHPLAGQDLNFAGTVKNVREASESEIEHGHVHREGQGQG